MREAPPIGHLTRFRIRITHLVRVFKAGPGILSPGRRDFWRRKDRGCTEEDNSERNTDTRGNG